MNKEKDNKKRMYYIAGSAIVTIAGIALFFFPEFTGYPYSYNNTKEKSEYISQLSSELSSKETRILEEIKALERQKKDSLVVERKAMNAKDRVNGHDFYLDIPSILIELEQNAIYNNVEIEIGYNSITNISGDGERLDDEMNESNEDTEESESSLEEGSEEDIEVTSNEDNSDDNEDSDDKTNDENETNDEDSGDIEVVKEEGEVDGDDSKEYLTEDFIKNNTTSIRGLDTTIIPIYIKGYYSDVRSYIKYLDEIGMIEPSSVSLKSQGHEIEGSILLNVFHGEVGL